MSVCPTSAGNGTTKCSCWKTLDSVAKCNASTNHDCVCAMFGDKCKATNHNCVCGSTRECRHVGCHICICVSNTKSCKSTNAAHFSLKKRS